MFLKQNNTKQHISHKYLAGSTILFLGISTANAANWKLNCVRDQAFSYFDKSTKNIEYYEDYADNDIENIKISKGITKEEPRYGEWATIGSDGTVTSSFGVSRVNDKTRPTVITGTNTVGDQEIEWSFKFIANNDPKWKLEDGQKKWFVNGYSKTYNQFVNGRYTCTWEKCNGNSCSLM